MFRLQEGRKHQAPAGGGLPNGAPAAGGDDGDGGEHHGEDHSDHTLVRTGKYVKVSRFDAVMRHDTCARTSEIDCSETCFLGVRCCHAI